MKIPFIARWFLLVAAASSLRAEVIVLGVPKPPEMLASMEECTLTAVADDGKPHEWQWKIVEGPAGSWLTQQPDGTARFGAFVVDQEDFWVELTDRKDWNFSLEVRIPVQPHSLFTEIMRSTLEAPNPEETWLPPALAPYVNEFESLGRRGVRNFKEIHSVHRVDDPHMGPFDQGLLVVDAEGLVFVDRHRKVTRVVKNNDIRPTDGAWAVAGKQPHRVRITAVAVRPPGSLPGNPWHVVLACLSTNLDGGYLFDFAPDGSLRQLAGGWPHQDAVLEGPIHRPGTPPAAGAVLAIGDDLTSMTMDAAGNLLLAEREFQTIRKISPTGMVSVFVRKTAERYRSYAGDVPEPGLFNGLMDLKGLTVDPVTGDLFCFNYDRMFRIDREGKVTRILGTYMSGWMPGDYGMPSLEEKAEVGLDKAVLNGPRDMVIYQGKIYFVEDNNSSVRSFDPKTRILENLCGHPMRRELHFGAMRGAAISKPHALCLGSGGSLMVALENRLVELRRILPPPPRPEVAAEELPEIKEYVAPYKDPGTFPWEPEFWARSRTELAESSASGKETKAAREPEATRAGDLVLYTVPGPPAASNPEAPIDLDSAPARGGSVVLTVRPRSGQTAAVTWSASAGTLVDLGGGRAQFKVPADAKSGSVFRLTARSVSAFSNSAVFETAVDLRIP